MLCISDKTTVSINLTLPAEIQHYGMQEIRLLFLIKFLLLEKAGYIHALPVNLTDNLYLTLFFKSTSTFVQQKLSILVQPPYPKCLLQVDIKQDISLKLSKILLKHSAQYFWNQTSFQSPCWAST